MSYITKRVPKKKEIAPDEVLTTTQKVSDWVRMNMNALIYSGGAVLFVLLVVFGVLWLRAGREKAAVEALSAAVKVYREDVSASEPSIQSAPPAEAQAPGLDASRSRPDLEASLEGFRKVAREHAGSRPGVSAQLYAANVLFRLGRYQESAEEAEKILEQSPDVAEDLNVRYILARAHEANGDLDKAIGIYTQLMDHRNVGDFRAVIMLDLARCLELTGNRERAVALLQEVVLEYPQTVLALKADKMLALNGVSGGDTL